MIIRKTLGLLSLTVLLFLGCSSAVDDDPAILSERERFLMSDEPAGALGIVEAREATVFPSDVVLLGRIGGDFETWQKGKATFVMSDLLADIDDSHDHGAADHDENCPFCKARKAKAGPSPTAIVEFHGEDGGLLAIDAQKLLPVQEGQLVVVQGKGQVDSIGNLTVSASGIYVRE